MLNKSLADTKLVDGVKYEWELSVVQVHLWVLELYIDLDPCYKHSSFQISESGLFIQDEPLAHISQLRMRLAAGSALDRGADCHPPLEETKLLHGTNPVSQVALPTEIISSSVIGSNYYQGLSSVVCRPKGKCLGAFCAGFSRQLQ